MDSTTAIESAKDFHRRGWAPIRIPRGEKNPGRKGWQNERWTAEDLRRQFAGECNIGVLLGEPSGWLIDVDLDHALAIELADQFLPETEAIFGRPGKPRSHRLYIARGTATHKRQATGAGMLVELRSTGCQTVAPGSVHPSGEAIAWAQAGEPAVVEATTLRQAVDDLANEIERRLGIAGRKNGTPRAPLDAVDRCRAYVAKMPEAISGSGGHNAAFSVAAVLFRFGLTDADARMLFDEYNSRCQPPWSDHEIEHKLADARNRVIAAGEFGSMATESDSARAKWRGRRDHDGSQRPTIMVGVDEMRVADEAIAALAKRDRLYQRGGQLVEVLESIDPPAGIIRPEGGLRAVALCKWRLRELLADSASFIKADAKGNETECAVPQTTVEQTLARGVWQGIPQLCGVVSSPQFLADGSVLASPGYNRRSGLYLAADCQFAAIPERPTKTDAEAARDILLEVIADFPFDAIGRAAWVAIVLTGVARYAIDGPTPLFALDANVRGSGKSLAADAAGVLLTGRQLPRTTAAGDDDEMRKRITAILLAGEPLVLQDNVAGVLGGPALDALLTSTTWTDRVLGSSVMTAAIPARAIWLATGNNLQFAADTARRTLRMRLVSMEERPEERTGFRHPNLLGWVRENRGRLAVAAATILRAWHLAGRPGMGLSPWGSFDAWSDIVRAAVAWVGLADPGAGRQEVQREADREAGLLRQMLNAWQEADPHGHGLTVVDAMKEADAGNEALAAVFVELADKNGKPNARSVGQKLRHLLGRVCGGRYFDKRDTNRGAAWLVRAATSDSKDNSDSKPSPPTREITTGTHTHAYARVYEGAGNTVTTPFTVTPCDHLNPSAWQERDGGKFCPGCGKWMGRAKAKQTEQP